MDQKKIITLALGIAACAATAFGVTVSSGDIRLGEWNSNFSRAKAYAESTHSPMLIYWGSTGCSQCKKMKTALDTTEFQTWQANRRLVMVLCQNESEPEARSCKAFVKNPSGDWPYMMVYWPKASGTTQVKFTGRSSVIPASGSSLQAKLMNCVDTYTAGWTGDPGVEPAPTPTPTPTPTPPAPPAPAPGSEWKRARVLTGSFYTQSGVLAGRIEVRAGRISSRLGVAQVKAVLIGIDNHTKQLGQKKVTVDRTTSDTLTGPGGTYAFSITGSEISGTVTANGVRYEVRPLETGGNIADGTLVFSLESYPTACQTYPVIGGTDYLPIDQTFRVASMRWAFDRKGALRYSRASGEFEMSDMANPSGLRLTYKKSNGSFKGSFTVYAQRSGTGIKRYTAKVTGFMVGDSGAGQATIRNVGTYRCTISR